MDPPKLSLLAEQLTTAGCFTSLVVVNIYNTIIPLIVALDSLELITFLSMERNSVDTSIRTDVIVITHDFDRHHYDRFVWIPGKENLGDPLPDVLGDRLVAPRVLINVPPMLARVYRPNPSGGDGR